MGGGFDWSLEQLLNKSVIILAPMQLYLAGHLGWYDPKRRNTFHLRLEKPTKLDQILFGLNVPLREIAVGVVNGKAVFALNEVIVTDADKVELYPPVDGG